MQTTSLTTPLASNTTTRLHEIDGLRVTLFGLLMLYHTGMLYVAGWDWHFKSQYQTKLLTNIMLWSNQWRMLMLFLLSGAALALFFRHAYKWRAVGKRLTQLLLPLLLGMFVVVVPQVYVEVNSRHLFDSPDFWHFWYIYLNQQSPEFDDHNMHLTWNHLWYLPYLFVYTLLIALLYPLLRSRPMQLTWQWLSSRLALWQLILLPILVFYLNRLTLRADYPVTHNLVEDWFNHGRSFFSFLLGFGLMHMLNLWRTLNTVRWYLLLAALLTYSFTLFVFHGGKLGGDIMAPAINGFFWAANSWLWVLCVIAWGQTWFTRPSKWVGYLNARVFCFYLLHQTLIILFSYWLTPFKLGAFIEPMVVILLVTIGCWVLFELIKPIPGMRVLFGIQLSSRK